ncbi:MAG: hypothetical protein B7Y36_01710 [Novosphingobium sp. 28-62-57]|nr:MAG: hypothetical protein B7Z34_08900 [Novosphingobium sp. 12-62-10]OYZ12284.1 MAG: hypothetical protein B7Y36_01710 [Novosphingobium sp. 28-62-57]OZA33235.1 MAG: hypothetical protein B7X92_11610 [Novosphingobium sp. 17-62-9]
MSETGGVLATAAVSPQPARWYSGGAILQTVGIPRWLIEAAGFLLLFAITRSFLFGNPVVHIDEQFYLFVAQRMQDGAIPYIDIWDRKPIGLFLLYKALVALPIDPVLAYQFGAGMAFTCTAMVITRIAREIAPPAAAWQAGAVYILFMPAFNAGMGQAPVFYNLLVAMAAWGVVEGVKRSEDKALIWRGSLIMLLLGLAIQIKYTVVFEGAAFGLILLSRGFADVWSFRRLLGIGLLWMALALLPTAAALAWFAHIGEAEAFLYANFISIFDKESDGWKSYWRLTKEVAALTPFWLAIFHASRKFSTTSRETRTAHRVITLWAIAAGIGFLSFGTWYDHYVAPLLMPLAILAAPALSRSKPQERWYGRLLLGFAAIAGLFVMGYQWKQHGSTRQFAAMDAMIRQEMHGGCLFIYEGEMAFYRTTNTCLPTRWTFPNHLNTYVEAPAIGVDPAAEVRRVLATKPDVIVMRGDKHTLYLPNMETRAMIKAGLVHDYVRYARVPLGNKEYWLYRPRR